MSTSEIPAPESAPIAGFWRRLIALAIDSMVLGIFGSGVGWSLCDVFAGMGAWGRLIGFLIAVTYFGVMNSSIFDGQTFGKRVMKIRVVTRNGEPLGVGASFARAAILCTPVFMNQIAFGKAFWPNLLQGVLLFGLGLSILYLYVFNRRTRQSLHDLAVGSFVVKALPAGAAVRADAPWRGHYAVVALLIALPAGLPILVLPFLNQGPIAYTTALSELMAKEPGVREVLSVQEGWMKSAVFNRGAQTSTNLTVTVVPVSKAVDPEELANRIARIALDAGQKSAQKDWINVSVSYGYDIGIASAWRRDNFSFTPAQWRERLGAGG